MCSIVPQLWVDEERRVVYFEGNSGYGLEKHLYVNSLLKYYRTYSSHVPLLSSAMLYPWMVNSRVPHPPS